VSRWSESEISTFVDHHTLPELEELYLRYFVSQATNNYAVFVCARYVVCDYGELHLLADAIVIT